MKHLTFLTEFTIVLACMGGAAFAWQVGLLQAIWAADESYMTSAIAALFVVTCAVIMRSAWAERDSSFGHVAEGAFPLLGGLGTAYGISMQAEALATNGMASAGALKTVFFATMAGFAASFIVKWMTYFLEKDL